MDAMKRLILIAAAAVLAGPPAMQTAETDTYLIYVGTYTGGVSKGIYAFRFQPSTGRPH